VQAHRLAHQQLAVARAAGVAQQIRHRHRDTQHHHGRHRGVHPGARLPGLARLPLGCHW